MSQPFVFYSPFRYPGGKSSFSTFLSQVVTRNLDIQYYAEPYAGGAGAALSLLMNGYVKEIFLNEKNPFLYSFWKIMKMDPDSFIERVKQTPVKIRQWEKQRALYYDPKAAKLASTIDKAFCVFFLNRCNRSGILNAGPIGGKHQNGKYSITARYNVPNLVERLYRIKEIRTKIHVKRGDAINFMTNFFVMYKKIKTGQVLFYLDPPYFLKGKKLYRENYYTDEDHINLSRYLKSFTEKWLLSYDNADFIKNLYSNHSRQRSKHVEKVNWANYPKLGKELIMASRVCNLPRNGVKLSKSQLSDITGRF